jgi:hypothetical protein
MMLRQRSCATSEAQAHAVTQDCDLFFAVGLGKEKQKDLVELVPKESHIHWP